VAPLTHRVFLNPSWPPAAVDQQAKNEKSKKKSYYNFLFFSPLTVCPYIYKDIIYPLHLLFTIFLVLPVIAFDIPWLRLRVLDFWLRLRRKRKRSQNATPCSRPTPLPPPFGPTTGLLLFFWCNNKISFLLSPFSASLWVVSFTEAREKKAEKSKWKGIKGCNMPPSNVDAVLTLYCPPSAHQTPIDTVCCCS